LIQGLAKNLFEGGMIGILLDLAFKEDKKETLLERLPGNII